LQQSQKGKVVPGSAEYEILQAECAMTTSGMGGCSVPTAKEYRKEAKKEVTLSEQGVSAAGEEGSQRQVMGGETRGPSKPETVLTKNKQISKDKVQAPVAVIAVTKFKKKATRGRGK
jgi:hypothetical protein